MAVRLFAARVSLRRIKYTILLTLFLCAAFLHITRHVRDLSHPNGFVKANIAAIQWSCNRLSKQTILEAYISGTSALVPPITDRAYIETFGLTDSICTGWSGVLNSTVHQQLREEEAAVPIAYCIYARDSVDRIVRLLRAIYRPHNFYCIYTTIQNTALIQVLKNLAKCFGDNVVVKVVRRSNTLTPIFNCADFVLNRHPSWKYYITVSSDEFPLRTNWELTTLLKLLDDKSLIENMKYLNPSDEAPPSYLMDVNVNYFEGSFEVALHRSFVVRMLYDTKAQELLMALNTFSSEESRGAVEKLFFATLLQNAHLRASGWKKISRAGNLRTRASFNYTGKPGGHCKSGFSMRGICILGVENYTYLLKRPEFFAAAFHPNVQPKLYDCLESWHMEKIDHEIKYGILHPSFDLQYYQLTSLYN